MSRRFPICELADTAESTDYRNEDAAALALQCSLSFASCTTHHKCQILQLRTGKPPNATRAVVSLRYSCKLAREVW